ncbi:MAG: TonB-dependent receptor [Enterobacterales bacterium]|nr:TonB-dependent receptor [Enterobacterales bacterium]
MIFNKQFKIPILLSLSLSASFLHAAELVSEQSVESTNENTILVTAELQQSDLLKSPSSISIIDQQSIQRRNAQQLTDLLNLAPNVNFASGASRGRFIQIRGVGERSEFIENTNYSVGVVLDGIDLTGISNAATTLDIQQVEILRGPQGTLYGANGLAGLINLVSNAPTDYQTSRVETNFETYGGKQLSLVNSGPMNAKLAYRVAYKSYSSNGFMKNTFLNRKDTNNLDEQSFRAKLAYQITDNIRLNSSYFMADINNGYDAFSLDSNRTTLSDKPGKDTQKTNAFALSLDWLLSADLTLKASLSHADSDIEYAYDEDWSNPTICDNTACDSSLFGFDWWYSSYDQYLRQNQNTSLDIKLSSAEDYRLSWVAGLYFKQQTVDFRRQYTYAANDFTSQQDKDNLALYGQVSQQLSASLKLTAGLRLEHLNQAYRDNQGSVFSPKENLWGGRLSLSYDYATNSMIYGLISRGYKAGGVNADASIPAELRHYQTEFMWNYEAGLKGRWLDNRLQVLASVFYQDRKDIQNKQFIVRSLADGQLLQAGGSCPCSFSGLTDNAAAGRSYGLELEINWRVNDRFKLYQSLGLLNTQYTRYSSYTHIDADLNANPPLAVNLSGRGFAHAPTNQWVVGGEYQLTDHWSLHLELEGKSAFYFSDTHDAKSSSYQMTNLGVVYTKNDWRLNLYVNNLFDQRVETRAFGTFGNDPRNFYQTDVYYQFAAPRLMGLSIAKTFE